MSGLSKFPHSPEIKRVLKAVRDSGIAIGSVDIRPDGITILPKAKDNKRSAYDIWKAQNAD